MAIFPVDLPFPAMPSQSLIYLINVPHISNPFFIFPYHTKPNTILPDKSALFYPTPSHSSLLIHTLSYLLATLALSLVYPYPLSAFTIPLYNPFNTMLQTTIGLFFWYFQHRIHLYDKLPKHIHKYPSWESNGKPSPIIQYPVKLLMPCPYLKSYSTQPVKGMVRIR